MRILFFTEHFTKGNFETFWLAAVEKTGKDVLSKKNLLFDIVENDKQELKFYGMEDHARKISKICRLCRKKINTNSS